MNCMSIINYEGSSSIKTCSFFCLGDLLAQSAPFIVTPFMLAIFQPPWLPLLLPLLNLSCRRLDNLLLHKLFLSLSLQTASTQAFLQLQAPLMPLLLLSLSSNCLYPLTTFSSTQSLHSNFLSLTPLVLAFYSNSLVNCFSLDCLFFYSSFHAASTLLFYLNSSSNCFCICVCS